MAQVIPLGCMAELETIAEVVIWTSQKPVDSRMQFYYNHPAAVLKFRDTDQAEVIP
jgi:hypothetical protein